MVNFNLDVKDAVAVMRRGGIILYPTDTVWGLGCDATDSEAVKKIFSLKQRSDSKAMIILVDSEAMLERWVEGIPQVAYELIEAAVSPTTIIYDGARGLAPELLSADGSIAVRITREPFSAALCRTLGHPVVSTSANISGSPTPRFFNEIVTEIKERVDFIPGYRRDDTRPARPSSIIKLTESGVITIIR